MKLELLFLTFIELKCEWNYPGSIPYLLIREYVQYLLKNNNIISAVRDKGEYNTLFTLV